MNGRSSPRKRFLVYSVMPMALALALTAGAAYQLLRRASPRDPLPVRLDPAGPYLILASRQAEKNYAAAVAVARQLHPQASQAVFDPKDLEAVKKVLRQHRPRYALVFLEPGELDVNFAWQWLKLSTEVDDDPLVDVRTGFITGKSPQATEAFMSRIAAAVQGNSKLPGAFVDNLGPNTMAGKQAFFQNRGTFFVPVLDQRLAAETISHGTEGFDDKRLASMQGAGVVHLGGHGHPNRVDDGVTATQVARLQLSPCLVFNGACYTGVTGRWYDPFTAEHLGRRWQCLRRGGAAGHAPPTARCWPGGSPL